MLNMKGIALVAIAAITLTGTTVSLAPMNVMATTTDDEDGPALTNSITRNDDDSKIIESSDDSKNAAVENERTFKQADAGSAAATPAHEGKITLKDNEGEVFKEITVKSDDSSSAAKKTTFSGIEQEIEDVNRGGEAE